MASAIALKLEGTAWQEAPEELVRLATERAGLDFEEGLGLLRAHRSGAHLHLGYASFHEYTERIFGYGPRLSQEKLRVAEALEELPETARHLQTGAICFSLARELTRVTTPSTEQEWLEAARGRTVRQVEHLVAGHRPGSLPDDVSDPDLKRHVLRLELSGDVFATFREAMAKIRRDAGEPLDDDAAILLLCRQALEGPKDLGRSSYQIALTVCESCRRAKQQGRGELVDVGPEIVEMAECDGQHIGRVDAHVGANDSVNARLLVGVHDDDADTRARVRVHDDDADTRVHVGARHATNAREHVGAPARVHVGAPWVRATQTIPPVIRRAVLRRDGGKCCVPGCRHGVFTDAHHLVRRSEDGKHSLENLVTLCSAHHRAVHEGRLIIVGSASTQLHFTHADGTAYGGAVRPAVCDARTKALQALSGLGFREGEAKRALARISQSAASLEQVIRLALRELAPQ